MKLFLYSSHTISPNHREKLTRLIDKGDDRITVGAIVNAADVEKNSAGWVAQSRESLGYRAEVVDLKQYKHNGPQLRDKLARKDLIWVCGGNQYYLRWILKNSGADEVIRELVGRGTVYAGWSAGAVVAGPTLEHMEHLEDLSVVPEVLTEGLGLTDVVVLPHFDMEQFSEGMRKADSALRQAGFRTVPLRESQALLVKDADQRII